MSETTLPVAPDVPPTATTPILPEGPTPLSDLRSVIARAEGWPLVLEGLSQRRHVAVEGAWGSSSALAVATLLQERPGPYLIVVSREKEIDDWLIDLPPLTGAAPAVLPALGEVRGEASPNDPIYGARQALVRDLEAGTAPPIVLASVASLLQPVPSRAQREASTRVLRVGEDLDLDGLLAWLIERGFERVSAVELPGEVCVHGGIVDVFPSDTTDPIRIELFGDEIESIRKFDVGSQRKVLDLREVALTIVAMGTTAISGEACVLDALPAHATMVLVDLEQLTEEGKQFLGRLSDRRGLFSVEALWQRCQNFGTVELSRLISQHVRPTCRLRVESIERLSGPRSGALEELAKVLAPEERVLVTCHNAGAMERMRELVAGAPPGLATRIELCLGNVARGYRLRDERLVVVGDNELFGRTTVQRAPRKSRLESRVIDSFLDLQEGDLVVHLSHGIGRFRGMQLLEKEGQKEEHLKLEFKDAVQMFVPVSLIHLVQKYVGGTKAAPELSKVGGTAWARKKQKAAEAVSDMAGDMLRLQAEREAQPGFACPPDSHWQQEFEAAFPYTETDDQLRAIADLKDDMQHPRPMDRLICGDVGFGKTEVAIRAAFKAVDAGRQVAVLVPTTVLAEQHFRSFSERMAEFPVELASLSRFKTRGEQKQVLEGLAEGTVDICIGTHRLVQRDIRFKNLGLLIIDEEQRFGVDTKEQLKRMRLEVDVLTLSATPIPRTLHLSLLGIRSISSLETPPNDRIAVETRICRWDGELIRSAIVRELNRGGQCYFVHNRVYNIQSIADQLQVLVPEARIGIVHGQMTGDEMEAAMTAFVRGQTDVLVATTIIESGLDIPNANTMFIHQADQYGLADLHQLRGRVGRYKHRAYCYLVLQEGRSLTPQASRRLKAIEEYSELGAGFKIAMRDLEIRGTGNILGTEQSGHIAAIGYELYCHLLENAVRALKRQPLKEHRHVAVDLPVSAYLPAEYIPAGRLKIEAYRKITGIPSIDSIEALRAELRDRFGPIPPETETLIQIRELQLYALRWQIDDIHLEDGYAMLGYRNPRKIKKLVEASPIPVRILDGRQACAVLPRGGDQPDRVLGVLKSVLQAGQT